MSTESALGLPVWALLVGFGALLGIGGLVIVLLLKGYREIVVIYGTDRPYEGELQRGLTGSVAGIRFRRNLRLGAEAHGLYVDTSAAKTWRREYPNLFIPWERMQVTDSTRYVKIRVESVTGKLRVPREAYLALTQNIPEAPKLR